MLRRFSKELVTEDGSEVDDTVVACLSDLVAAPTVAIRRIGDSGISSRHGLPADIPGLLGKASKEEPWSDDDQCDGILGASVQMQFRALYGRRPDIQVREIDPTLWLKTTRNLFQTPADTRVRLAPHLEIEPLRGHLGAGSFGKAFHRTMKDSDFEPVVKVPHQGSDVRQKREVEMLSELKHVGPIQFHCLLRGLPDTLVPERCAGSSIANLLHGKMPSKDGLAGLCLRPRARASIDMVFAVEYLSTRHTGHCDIKGGISLLPALVCMPVADLPPFKFGDLGWARELAGHTAQYTGTWRYASPAVTCSNRYAEPADICSCSLLLYEGVSETFPPKLILDNLSVHSVLYFAQGAATDTSQYGPRVIDCIASMKTEPSHGM
mmetsp:Transcript_84448/g.247660  ORF Transcript_84448/g.247660 Transcript_84448/m.247660 type:complete len:379 (-) Transcript_84448:323-1459(-)